MGTELGDLVRAYRRRRGLTQEALEEISGISQNYISQIERGVVRTPGDEFLFRLSGALDLPMEEIRRAMGWVIQPLEEVQSVDGVPIRYYGVVPADSVRWVAAEREGEVRRVSRDWLGARDPDQFLVVRASGDCLKAENIQHGTYVLIRRTPGELPPSGKIVLVRVNDDHTLKILHRGPEGVELRDGDGNKVYTMNAADDIEIVGVSVAYWHLDLD